MKLDNRFGGTVVTTTDDIIDLLQSVFDHLADPTEVQVVRDDADSLEEENKELKYEIQKLRKQNAELHAKVERLNPSKNKKKLKRVIKEEDDIPF